jgi:predicted TIM-barrel fold metal-dependent hydrolase
LRTSLSPSGAALQAVIDRSYSGFSRVVTFMFANAGFGWHIETAIHALRVILGGVFDRIPKLQLILGQPARRFRS